MTEVELLRKEVEGLRAEVAALRAERVVHHYHHAPSPLQTPTYPYWGSLTARLDHM